MAPPTFCVPLLRAITLGALTAWLYRFVAWHLILQWYQDPNFSHGFLVLPFALWVLWRERAKFQHLHRKPSNTGMLLILLSQSLLVVGTLGSELFLTRVSFPLLLAGFVVFFLGWNYLESGLFAWAILFLMIPLPAIVMNQLTFPLQLLASRVAATTLPLLGVPALREGNIISLPAMPLEVAEACSGIRSLFSLVTLAVFYGYLVDALKWVRVALAVAAIPIAIIANSLRIVGTGLLVEYWNPEKAQGFFHLFSGWMIFMVSMLLFLPLHRFFAWMGKERAL